MRVSIVIVSVLLFSFGACMKKGEVKNQESMPGELLSSRTGVYATANSLAFDQAFIDFVYHASNNLRSSLYIKHRLNDQAPVFIRQLASCSSSQCTDQKLNEFGLNGDVLDEYIYSALASGLILIADHPELVSMSAANRNTLLEQAFNLGYASTDQRWIEVRSNLDNMTANFYEIIQYKTAPGGAMDYVSCIVNEIKSVFIDAMKITGIVGLIQKGEVAKTIGAVKSFLRSTLGRTLSWIGIAFMAWDIFECMWDVAHPNTDDSFLEHNPFNNELSFARNEI